MRCHQYSRAQCPVENGRAPLEKDVVPKYALARCTLFCATLRHGVRHRIHVAPRRPLLSAPFSCSLCTSRSQITPEVFELVWTPAHEYCPLIVEQKCFGKPYNLRSDESGINAEENRVMMTHKVSGMPLHTWYVVMCDRTSYLVAALELSIRRHAHRS